MTEAIKQAKSTIDELTDAKVVQAILTIILTITIAFLFAFERQVPQELYLAWFTMLGVYMEIPKKAQN